MKTRQIRRKQARRAFTLLEVLMVIVILGLLAALVAPQFFGTGEKAKIDLTRNMIEGTLRSQLELFRTHCTRYPTSDEGLAALAVAPDDDELKDKWAGPYVKSKDLRDAWQHEFQYESPGTHNEDGFDVVSAGPNGQFGDDDDIANWER